MQARLRIVVEKLKALFDTLDPTEAARFREVYAAVQEHHRALLLPHTSYAPPGVESYGPPRKRRQETRTVWRVRSSSSCTLSLPSRAHSSLITPSIDGPEFPFQGVPKATERCSPTKGWHMSFFILCLYGAFIHVGVLVKSKRNDCRAFSMPFM